MNKKVVGGIIGGLILLSVIGALIPDDKASQPSSSVQDHSLASDAKATSTSVYELDVRGFKLGMSIEDAASAMYEDFSQSERKNYYNGSIKSAADILRVFNKDHTNYEMWLRVRKLRDEKIDKPEISKRLGLDLDVVNKYANYDYTWHEIKRSADGNYIEGYPGDLGQYAYGQIDARWKKGFEVTTVRLKNRNG